MKKTNITVFTPTYNRAHLIENLYRSLQRQTCYDFEWLVVDDGSADNTQELFAVWVQESNPFPVRYYRQENGGKHRAVNRGLELALGELFFIVDSDDCLTDHAIEMIHQQVRSLPINGPTKYAGVCNLKAYSLDHPVGTSFEGDYLDCTSLEREKYGITGDKAEVIFTDIIRKYPFPEFEGEKFVTEAVVWDRIAADGYAFRFYNQVNYLCEYREDGLTLQGQTLYHNNPQGYGLYLRQCRQLCKFSKPVQSYHEIQCYFAWKNNIGLCKIAELLQVNKWDLVFRASLYSLRERMSKIKQKIIQK